MEAATYRLAPSAPLTFTDALGIRQVQNPDPDVNPDSEPNRNDSFFFQGLEITANVVTDGDPLKGDVDRNGEVNFFDIQPFIGVLSSPDFQAEADTNCDMVVDFFDIQPFIDILAGN